ncbi:DeoR/GlpR family DNA-binding transcription regulator [Halobacillus litoralis]|uniref:DeoR/GlpR family DNA-binding transcription regulator n=1 Tax=Halobacillus litoralis TaxID=45668 RepID=UPI001CD5E9C0|nr:DeoR/GlpR family DNA-binding transcription regulator [Halobacillus litoralis]MCA0971670.1 DeoR/GlpR family DNA-binding transcription regulator [Halobacillus litoralis]
MLTPERQQLILESVKNHHTVKIKDLVNQTGSSESTIRRDLDQLEQKGLLQRVHGGASLLQTASEELSMGEKSIKNAQEKESIALHAASLIKDGDCVFLDAGSTTYAMIPHLRDKEIIVVTNGLNHLDLLSEHHIKTYVLGGLVKHRTQAVIGTGAMQTLQQYRFDKCFIGANGIHATDGYTTPDPEEAAIKQAVIHHSRQRYILADHTKFEQVSFTKFAELHEADIITDDFELELNPYKEKTTVKVVTT